MTLNPKKIVQYYKDKGVNYWIIFFVLIYCVLVIKLVTFQKFDDSVVFAVYSIAVSFYILSRFFLAHFYSPKDGNFDPNYVPRISFAIPAKNEEGNIRETIVRIAKTDYPKDKFNIIVVNDGSTDNTLEEMEIGGEIANSIGVEVEIVNWEVNRGKRPGMAECVKRSQNDILIFIDSDSFVEPDTAKELVKYFVDPSVAAVTGHAYVANADKNILTKMQNVRYFVAFKAYKAAESLFGATTCCSGCCSAYRRDYVLEELDKWSNQKFLGVECTYGDDRSLTNFLLKKGYKTLFAPEAVAQTFVPDTFQGFMKQQLRWKKSWLRENFRGSFFMWRQNPIMSISFYLGVLLPLVAPIVVIRAVVWYPYVTGEMPWFYILGLLLMATIYGLYYYIYTRDRKWFYGVLFAAFYTLVLIWQLPWAIVNLRDPKWGTR